MSNTNSVHQCLFCTEIFESSAAKDDHILKHFVQETCADCNQDLIRIAGNLYVLHTHATCIKEYDEDYYDDVSSKLATVLVEDVIDDTPNEQQTDGEEDHLQDDALEVELGEWMKTEPQSDEYDNFENQLQAESIEADGEEEAATNDSTAEYSTMDEDSQQQEEEEEEEEVEEKPNISTAESMNDENLSQEALDLTGSNKINIKLEMDANANTDAKAKSTKKEDNKRECEFCGEFFHRYALYRHKRDVHNPTICVCQICHTNFKSEEYLQRHMRYKHGATANVFKCDKCLATFRKEDLFRIHQCNVIQSNENRGMTCEKCGKEFSRKQTLLKHQVLVHSKSETIHCKACARVFSDADERDAHQTECAAKKNKQLSKYSTTCEICGKRLSRHGALVRHMASQH